MMTEAELGDEEKYKRMGLHLMLFEMTGGYFISKSLQSGVAQYVNAQVPFSYVFSTINGESITAF